MRKVAKVLGPARKMSPSSSSSPAVVIEQSVSRRHIAGICLVLVLLTAFAYGQAPWFRFVVFDDPAYLVQPRHVRDGLTGPNIVWAFTGAHHCNWHPVTTLSFLAEASLFGIENPRPYHVTNVVGHIAAAVVLFLTLVSMTGSPWRSGFVAGLFALHPLHVESVAWVSERKDVLSALFMFLTLAAYSAYARRGGAWQYGLILVLFALGLMSKPMLVTLPFVLLLLDVWPLGRMEGGPVSLAGVPPARRATLRQLVMEKIPLLVMVAVSSAVTFLVQRHCGAMATMENTPLAPRLANAVVAYFQYVCKAIWPTRLVPLYAYEIDTSRFPLNLWPLAAAALAAITIGAIIFWRRRPYLAVGWLWFVGMLVPVIGLVQVGQQSIADRYTYLPLCGVFIAVTWGACDLAALWRHRHVILGGAAMIILIVCSVMTRAQAAHWRDSEALFRHGLRYGRENATMHYALGEAYREQRRFDEAIEQYTAALRIDPNHIESLATLPLVLQMQGSNERTPEMLTRARTLLEQATQATHNAPQYRTRHSLVVRSLGLLQMQQGDLAEAERLLREAVRIDPENLESRTSLGAVLIRRNNFKEADEVLSGVLRDDPKHAAAHVQVGLLQLAQNQPDKAIASLTLARQLDPRDREADLQLGRALLQAGRAAEARQHFLEFAQRYPTDPRPYFQIGVMAQSSGDIAGAASAYQEALRRDAKSSARNNLAWLRATAPRAQDRDGAEAVRLAESLRDEPGGQRPEVLDTLAAAYAESGDFSRAAETARAAAALADKAGDAKLGEAIRQRVTLYEKNQPYRE